MQLIKNEDGKVIISNNFAKTLANIIMAYATKPPYTSIQAQYIHRELDGAYDIAYDGKNILCLNITDENYSMNTGVQELALFSIEKSQYVDIEKKSRSFADYDDRVTSLFTVYDKAKPSVYCMGFHNGNIKIYEVEKKKYTLLPKKHEHPVKLFFSIKDNMFVSLCTAGFGAQVFECVWWEKQGDRWQGMVCQMPQDKEGDYILYKSKEDYIFYKNVFKVDNHRFSILFERNDEKNKRSLHLFTYRRQGQGVVLKSAPLKCYNELVAAYDMRGGYSIYPTEGAFLITFPDKNYFCYDLRNNKSTSMDWGTLVSDKKVHPDVISLENGYFIGESNEDPGKKKNR